MVGMLASFQFKIGRRFAVSGFLTLAALLSFTASAAGAAPARPDGGTILEGAKTPEQPAESSVPELKVIEPQAASADNTQRIRVNVFRFSGELPVPETDLQQVAAGQVGKDLTLNDLNQLAGQIEHYLRERGFAVATAYIPAQTIQDGIVEIAVVPGKYGAININNQAWIGDERLKKMSVLLREGEVVTKAELERVLLLINDLPGVGVKATLAPGKDPGTTDLTLNISDTAKYTGSLYADNWGNRFTGAVRGGFGANVANFSHSGDAMQIGGQTAGDGLKGFNFNYNLPLGYRGARWAFDYSRIDYTLGEDFAKLDAEGDTNVFGLTVSYPFRRSRSRNLYGTIGFDYKDLYDEIGAIDAETPKTDRIWKLGLSGNFTDRWRGVNQYALTYYYGDLYIADADAASIDSTTGNTAGSFNKLTFNYRRHQALNLNYSMEISFGSQLSDSNLDSSEKLYLGGADGVRAYPQGEAAADQGVMLTVEFKRAIPKWSNLQNNVYLVNFYDLGFGQMNKELWDGADEANYRTLSDIGLGLGWMRRDFNLRLDYAVKLGGGDAESDTDRNDRIWVRGIRYF
jgi:hemolysin activation/secretion protein